MCIMCAVRRVNPGYALSLDDKQHHVHVRLGRSEDERRAYCALNTMTRTRLTISQRNRDRQGFIEPRNMIFFVNILGLCLCGYVGV